MTFYFIFLSHIVYLFYSLSRFIFLLYIFLPFPIHFLAIFYLSLSYSLCLYTFSLRFLAPRIHSISLHFGWFVSQSTFSFIFSLWFFLTSFSLSALSFYFLSPRSDLIFCLPSPSTSLFLTLYFLAPSTYPTFSFNLFTPLSLSTLSLSFLTLLFLPCFHYIFSLYFYTLFPTSLYFSTFILLPHFIFPIPKSSCLVYILTPLSKYTFFLHFSLWLSLYYLTFLFLSTLSLLFSTNLSQLFHFNVYSNLLLYFLTPLCHSLLILYFHLTFTFHFLTHFLPLFYHITFLLHFRATLANSTYLSQLFLCFISLFSLHFLTSLSIFFTLLFIFTFSFDLFITLSQSI